MTAPKQDTQRYKVSNPFGMWLRTAPIVDETTKIALLPYGHSVIRSGSTDKADWWRIQTDLEATTLEGVGNKPLLTPETDFTAPPAAVGIQEVHLYSTSPVKRDQKGMEAFALNESPRPARDGGTTEAEKVEQLSQIIGWLGVSHSKRYLPTETTTFCNVYAYDYCYLAKAYIPRVWWSSTAIQKLLAGQPVDPKYGVTVDEITANQFTNWFHNYGKLFGWRKTESLTEIQLAANSGRVCAINAGKNAGHGHICLVVPETGTYQAEWDSNHARVLKPLTSQAGRHNFEYKPQVWWSEDYYGLGFWIHD